MEYMCSTELWFDMLVQADLESSNAEFDVNLDRRVCFTGLPYDTDQKKRQPDQHNQPNQHKATSKDLDKPALLLPKVTWKGLQRRGSK